MVPFWRKKEKVKGVTFEQFEGDKGFALDAEGQRVAAVKLPSTAAKAIAGQAAVTTSYTMTHQIAIAERSIDKNGKSSYRCTMCDKELDQTTPDFCGDEIKQHYQKEHRFEEALNGWNPCLDWWKNRQQNAHAWKVSVRDVLKYDEHGNLLSVNLDIKNPAASYDR